MRLLVTGGRGYIGGRLVKALAGDANIRVTLAGRERSGARENATVAVDWHEPASVEAICRGQDAIVHLAAMNEPDCENNPEEALKINGLAVLTLVRLAAATGVARLIYVSSSKVFGNNPAGTLSEASLPRPVSHYAITHRIAEDYVLAATGKKTLAGIVLRLSNCLGAPVDPSVNAWMLIANDLCRQAATTQRISLRGSGLAWRNFVGMADVVAAIRHVLELPQERIGDGLFHLGGPRSDRIWDLAQLVGQRAEALFGGPVDLQRAAPAHDEYHPPLEWRIDKLMATGWAPRQPLADEVDTTLRVCRETFGKSMAARGSRA
jgi:UDP-glucose 4-epimerase